MGWDNIFKQERVKTILQRAILEKKIGGSYIFSGIEGIGKDAIALQFAKTVNCLSPILRDNTIDCCEVCSSCKQITKLSSPNLEFIFAMTSPAGGDLKSENPFEKLTASEIEDIKKETLAKSENPYHKIELIRANQIRISQIRSLKKKLSLSNSSNFGRRFVIISEADKMGTEAANAFLKTLEEPYQNVTIILTTSRADSLLPTIQSRCQNIRISPIEDDDVAQYLVDNYNLEFGEAKISAAFAQGSLLKAISSINESNTFYLEKGLELLRTLCKKNYFRTELLNLIESISIDKALTEKILQALLFWMRDVYILSLGSNQIINIKKIDVLEKFTSAYRDKDIKYAICEIEDSINSIGRNFNMRLILINLSLKLRSILLFDKKNI